jgi:hypothetical protein
MNYTVYCAASRVTRQKWSRPIDAPAVIRKGHVSNSGYAKTEKRHVSSFNIWTPLNNINVCEPAIIKTAFLFTLVFNEAVRIETTKRR